MNCSFENCKRPVRGKGLCKYHLRILLRPKPVFISVSTYVKILKEHYSFHWENKKDEIKNDLIEKYKDKVSKMLLVELYALKEKAAEAGSKKMFQPINKNPFLSLINKENETSGKYYPVPIDYQF